VALFTMPLTFATTRLPRRPLVAVTVAFWSVGAIVQATADSYGQLMAGRVMAGLGHALFWAVVTPAAASMFAAANRGKSVARLLLGASFAGVVGLPTATWLAQRTDWQTPFWVLGAAGAVVAVAIAILMPTFRTEEGTVARGELPSLRRYLRILVITLLTVGSMAVTWTYVTPFFTDVTGFADGTVPVLLAMGGIVGVVSMWLVGRYLDRWPVKSAVLGLALLAAVWAGFATVGTIKPLAVVVLLVHGFTWSIIVAALVNWALRHTTWTSDIGNAAYASTFNLGNVLGSTLGAGLLYWHGARWLPAASFVLVAAALAIAWSVRPRGLARR
jgi:DHA1 family inner membrane transport protein